ncbi:hypothetical protein [Streptomyces sp. V4I2]|uniref:hypothetical protein n=1 Tax=Streptomyces sp. V4I2 TaxID=3042280 RepID=UPI00278986ED|nr:hypothetical protein [Streptomyces sp. V4I2]MDQ1051533.1 hypothetical protein [Streptomyces sp. V4I2]
MAERTAPNLTPWLREWGDAMDRHPGGEHRSAIKPMQGFLPLHNVVETSGMDVDMDVHLEKTVESYDWHFIFALYDAPLDTSLAEWVDIYRRHSDPILLDRMFPFLEKQPFRISCRVTVQISSGDHVNLRLGVRMLRLERGEEQKDVALLNAANIVALTPDGAQYHRIVAHWSER